MVYLHGRLPAHPAGYESLMSLVDEMVAAFGGGVDVAGEIKRLKRAAE